MPLTFREAIDNSPEDYCGFEKKSLEWKFRSLLIIEKALRGFS